MLQNVYRFNNVSPLKCLDLTNYQEDVSKGLMLRVG